MEKVWLKSYDQVVPPEINRELPALTSFIEAAAQNYPEHTAIHDGKISMKYREFARITSIIAGNLRIHGIEKQERIAVFLPNCSETILAFWSTITAGAVGVMTNPLYMETELVHQFNDSGARFVITNEQLWAKVAPVFANTRLEKAFVICENEESAAKIIDNRRVFSWSELLHENSG